MHNNAIKKTITLILTLLFVFGTGFGCYAETEEVLPIPPVEIDAVDTDSDKLPEIPKTDDKKEDNNDNKDDVKKDDTSKDETKQDDTKKDDTVKDDTKKDNTKSDNTESPTLPSEIKTKDDYIKTAKYYADNMGDDDFLAYYVTDGTNTYKKSLNPYSYDKNSGERDIELNKKRIYNIFADVYDVLNKYSSDITKQEYDKIINEQKDGIAQLEKSGDIKYKKTWLQDTLGDYKITICIASDFGKKIKGLKIELCDNVLSTPWGYRYVKNPAELINAMFDFTKKNYDNLMYDENNCGTENTYMRNFDWDNKTCNGEALKIYETLNFDLPVTEDLVNTLIYELADKDKTVKCTVERTKVKNNDITIITLKGDKGTKVLYLGAVTGSAQSGIIFERGKEYYKDKKVLSRKINSCWNKNEKIQLKGEYGAEYKLNVFFKIENDTKTVTVKCDTVDYVCHDLTEPWTRNVPIFRIFGDKEDAEYVTVNKKTNHYVRAEQNPEKYQTIYKGTEANGKYVYDYNILYVAKADLNIKSSAMPDWYKKLGDNVTITFTGMDLLGSGEVYGLATFIKFKGDDGEETFKSGYISTFYDRYYVEAQHKSIISFKDGILTENKNDYDEMTLRIEFTQDGKFDVDKFIFKIGGRNIDVKAEDVSYIGDGRANRGTLW